MAESRNETCHPIPWVSVKESFGTRFRLFGPALGMWYTPPTQHQHAMRVRAIFLARQIRKIEQCSEGEEADRLFGDLMNRVGLIDDGPAWFVIEKQGQKTKQAKS